jgi:AraC-binding-like domain
MTPARQHLPRSVLDTNQLPKRQRAPLWRDSATSVWDVERITDDGFYAYVDAFQAGDLMFGTVKSSGQATERARSRIASDSLDYYMLQFYVRGQRSATARGHEVLAQGGDLLVVDMTQQLQTRSTEYQSFDLVLPRRLFDPLLGDPDAFGGALFASQQPLVALLRSHLLALYEAGPDMTQDQAIAMQGPSSHRGKGPAGANGRLAGGPAASGRPPVGPRTERRSRGPVLRFFARDPLSDHGAGSRLFGLCAPASTVSQP